MKVAANGVELFCRIEGQRELALVMHGGFGAGHKVFLNNPLPAPRYIGYDLNTC